MIRDSLVKTKFSLTFSFTLTLLFVVIRAQKNSSDANGSQKSAHILKDNESIPTLIKSSSQCNLLILHPTLGNDVIFDEKFKDESLKEWRNISNVIVVKNQNLLRRVKRQRPPRRTTRVINRPWSRNNGGYSISFEKGDQQNFKPNNMF